MTKSGVRAGRSLTPLAKCVKVGVGGDRLMSTIVIDASQWASKETRRETLRQARKEARAAKGVVYIKVQYPKRMKVLVATVDARWS